jgi:cyclase
MKEVLRAGADKVSLNTAAIKNPDIIRDASLEFGASTIVVTIEAIQGNDGKYLAYTDNGRDYTGIEVLEWAQRVESLGAGELVITSVDKEGTGEGYDIELTKMIAQNVSIPVIAHGGAGKITNIHDVIKKGRADAITLASMLHYQFITERPSVINDRDEGNTEFLKSKKDFTKCDKVTISEIKMGLRNFGVPCRV